MTDSRYTRLVGTALGALLFLICSFFYSSMVFFNFSVFEIFGLLLSYSLIWVIGWFLLSKDQFLKLHLRNQDSKLEVIFISVLIATFLFLLLLTCLDNWSLYAPTFPLIEAELGLGWHQDTAFHVSLIQSIKNFGYPSIMQDGHPLIAYHALSHYVDALLISVNNVEVYDSYGLIFLIK